MPTLSELFNLDPNVERLSLLPRLRGSLPSEKSVMMPDRYMPDVIAPKILYDFIRAIKAPGRAAKGEALDEEEALNTAMNMFGGGLATSGSVPLGALGMSARTAPAGSIPLREVPRSPLGFYSALEQATVPLQNKSTGAQFLAQIEKTAGVKPEEVKWTGLDEFLKSRQNVTKQEVQDYLTANRVNLQEVRLGGSWDDFRAKKLAEYKTFPDEVLADQANIPFGPRQQEAFKNEPGFRDRIINKLVEAEVDYFRGNPGDLDKSFNLAKFSQFTIPGGENYRELLLTLPRKTVQAEPLDVSGFSVRTTEDAMRPYTGQRDIEVLDSAGNVVSRRSGFRGTDEEAIQNYAGTVTTQAQKADESLLNYRSSHFDQPNILTHLRANDRVIDGKKALFIEEIQSDWHQAGRKKGYNKLPDDAQVVQSPYTGNFIVQRANGNYLGESAATREEAIQSAIKHFGGVPDAPFKKSWHELALKRAIQEAVDKGYDKLAFTTGKTQVERYPEALRQVADEIVWDTYGGGTRHVMVKKNGATIFGAEVNKNGIIERANQDELIGKNLEEVIGKPMTQRAITEEAGEIKGKDFTVGGKGMEGFYDEILPKALQNLTKKYGTKVTKSKLDEGSEVWSMDITPQMREQIKSKGQPLFATAPPLGLASQDPLEQFLGYQEAENDPLMQFLGQK